MGSCYAWLKRDLIEANGRYRDSSSGEDDGRRVQDHSETEDEYEYDVRKERMEALSKATAGNGRRNASEKDFVRQIPASMTLTTAQQRTRMTMFG